MTGRAERPLAAAASTIAHLVVRSSGSRLTITGLAKLHGRTPRFA